MMGGNTQGIIQMKTTVSTNAIGEKIESWQDTTILTGYLDYRSGENGYLNNKAKVEDSSHIFICDFTDIELTAENKRMAVNGKIYDILLIDDVMGLHDHLEIHLRYTGG